jgi:hypothetical protein
MRAEESEQSLAIGGCRVRRKAGCVMTSFDRKRFVNHFLPSDFACATMDIEHYELIATIDWQVIVFAGSTAEFRREFFADRNRRS